MEPSEKIAELLFKHLRNELTREEERDLNDWRFESDENQILYKKLTDKENVLELMKDFYSYKVKVWNKIVEQAPELEARPTRRIKGWKPLSAAAVVILICGGIYLWFHEAKKTVSPGAENSERFKNDISPGGNRAILTLGSGSTINLDSSQNGAVAEQGNVRVVKLDSGKLSYEPVVKGDAAVGNGQPAVQYNTLTTPRGGQFQLVLSDGTKVWLNAASSLRYPTAFSSDKREVELTGEAYFEVNTLVTRGGKKIPFNVSFISGKVEVLGTHFNVMSYPDERVSQTTLLEGSVSISSSSASTSDGLPQAERKPGAGSGQTIILKPGEQAQVSANAPDIHVFTGIDTDKIVAWKNGKTSFKDADIKTIMRTVARWYDVTIVYEGSIPERKFSGGIPRNTNLSQLLKALELNNIHFKIDGRQITVMP